MKQQHLHILTRELVQSVAAPAREIVDHYEPTSVTHWLPSTLGLHRVSACRQCLSCRLSQYFVHVYVSCPWPACSTAKNLTILPPRTCQHAALHAREESVAHVYFFHHAQRSQPTTPSIPHTCTQTTTPHWPLRAHTPKAYPGSELGAFCFCKASIFACSHACQPQCAAAVLHGDNMTLSIQCTILTLHDVVILRECGKCPCSLQFWLSTTRQICTTLRC